MDISNSVCNIFFMAFVGAYITQNLSNKVLEYITCVYFLLISLFSFGMLIQELMVRQKMVKQNL